MRKIKSYPLGLIFLNRSLSLPFNETELIKGFVASTAFGCKYVLGVTAQDINELLVHTMKILINGSLDIRAVVLPSIGVECRRRSIPYLVGCTYTFLSIRICNSINQLKRLIVNKYNHPQTVLANPPFLD